MSKKVNTSSGGCSMLGLLGAVFVALKLTGYIAWSWWWVTAPFWGGLALLFGILVLIGVGLLIGAIIVATVECFKK